MIGSILQRIADSLGYIVLSKQRYWQLRALESYKPSDSVFDEHLKHVFERHRIDTVLDVGANDGAYAESLRRDVGFTGTIHSFEPIPSQVAVLKSKAEKDPRWIIHACALGARSGELPLHVMKSDVFSSFLEPSSTQPDKYASSNSVARTIDVPVKTVADIVQTLPGARIHLKMDTQGYDMEVFAGALDVLQQIHTLQSELAFRPIYENAPTWEEALPVLQRAGYRPSLLFPISFDDQIGMIEADGVFIRD